MHYFCSSLQMGMNLLNKAANTETRGQETNTNKSIPPNRAFINDLTLTTETHMQARWMLSVLEETANWARMIFKPNKSRSLIIRKDKQTDRFIVKIQGEDIPSITDNSVKYVNGFMIVSTTRKAYFVSKLNSKRVCAK